MSAKQTTVKIDYERLRSLSRRVHLQEVSLIGVNFLCRLPPGAVHEASERSFTYSLRGGEWIVDSGVIAATLDFAVGARALQPSDGAAERVPLELFDVNSLWRVAYALRPDDGDALVLDDNLMADFCFANGQLNVYPYVRQLVQDLTGRAGWPPLVLGVFTAPGSRPAGVVRRAELEVSEAPMTKPRRRAKARG